MPLAWSHPGCGSPTHDWKPSCACPSARSVIGTVSAVSTKERPPTGTPPRTPAVVGILGIVLGSLVLGAATSYAQTYLPESLRSFANSMSGWTALTALLVGLARPRLLVGAVLGGVSIVCLVLGYALVAELRGFAYNPIFWCLVGIAGGPLVGTAAAALTRRRDHAALGSGLLAGILVTDGVYGLTVVGKTTSPVYWTLAILTGLGLAAVVAAVRLRALRLMILQVAAFGVTLVFAGAAYGAINIVH
jgi:hypothetical protein